MKQPFVATAAVFLGAVLIGAVVFAGTPAVAAPDDSAGPVQFVIDDSLGGGPLDQPDLIFLEKVRQAGLWEIPMGMAAQQRAASQRVKEVGRALAADHVVLDEDVRKVASRLSVPLVNEASWDQQRWMAELNTLEGEAFDRRFAYLLRAAHGAVFAAIAQIRAGTRNELIRAFSEHCASVVNKHMRLLESTKMLNYADLPKSDVPLVNNRTLAQTEPMSYLAIMVISGAIAVAGITRALRGTS